MNIDASQLLIVFVALLSSAIASVSGFGIGSLLTPTLALQMDLKLAVALVTIPHFVATALRCFMLRKHIDKSVCINFGIASAIGGLVGALGHNLSGSPILVSLFSILLVFAGFLNASGLSDKFVIPKRLAPFVGVVSGIFGGMVGNQGGIRSAALLSMELSKESLVASATVVGVIVDSARLPIYILQNGLEFSKHAQLLCVMTIACILGTCFGKMLLSKIPDAIFRRIVGALILALGAYMFSKLFQWR